MQKAYSFWGAERGGDCVFRGGGGKNKKQEHMQGNGGKGGGNKALLASVAEWEDEDTMVVGEEGKGKKKKEEEEEEEEREKERRLKAEKHEEDLRQEILKTEIRYVDDLCKLREIASGITEDILSRDLRKKLFPGTLLTLAKVHEEFLVKLRGAVDQHDTPLIGELFLQLAPFLNFYPPYVNDFELQLTALKEERKVNPALAAYIKSRVDTGDVGSLLITPVQRIPRYLMFMKGLRKHCDDPKLQKAETSIDKIAVLIDRKAKEAEAAHGVTEAVQLIEGLPGNIVSAHRKYLLMVDLYLSNAKKIGKKKWRERTVFLFNDLIIWTKRNPSSGQYVFSSQTVLNNVTVEEGRCLALDATIGGGSAALHAPKNKSAALLGLNVSGSLPTPQTHSSSTSSHGGFLGVFRKSPKPAKDDAVSPRGDGSPDVAPDLVQVEFPDDCVSIGMTISNPQAPQKCYDIAIMDKAKRDLFMATISAAIKEQCTKMANMTTLRDNAQRHRRAVSSESAPSTLTAPGNATSSAGGTSPRGASSPRQVHPPVVGKDEGGFGLVKQPQPQQQPQPNSAASKLRNSELKRRQTAPAGQPAPALGGVPTAVPVIRVETHGNSSSLPVMPTNYPPVGDFVGGGTPSPEPIQQQPWQAASPPPLPYGWDQGWDPVSNRVFYINHLARTTQWEYPH